MHDAAAMAPDEIVARTTLVVDAPAMTPHLWANFTNFTTNDSKYLQKDALRNQILTKNWE